ncbi:MAG: Gfo/Idh/MocA family oxidoreductase [Candidatus Solibacter usitatus]|nr:Gfo/Idh/MocA family oxidoreductase [Candidatus Solibacter usitatus]
MTVTRRAVIATAASYQRILGANDRVQVGFIGYGLIGKQHVFDFKSQRDVDMAAMCETHQPRLEEGLKDCGPNAKGYRDFRKMLENKDLQAIVVSTPDHWHALMTILACEAGKDVYVEKPLTLFIDEGKWMVKAARRNKRVVQTGTQQRSGLHYQKARKLIREGYLGKVLNVRMNSARNITPGFGKFSDGPIPSELDYEMWLGPAPKRPYNHLRSLYHFRWFWDYSGGQMTNLGAHSIDIMQWFLNVKGPVTVSSVGGRYALESDGEVPDTQDAVFQYPSFTAICSLREAAAGRRASGLEFLGNKASMVIDRGGFEITPEMKIDPNNAVPQFRGHTTGGVNRSQTKPEPYTQAMKEPGSGNEQFDLHVRNFLDCIKTRQRPISDVEDGHQITTACHLANMSLRLGGRSIRWDAEKEIIVGDAEAAAMMRRPYRAPWNKVLESLKLG